MTDLQMHTCERCLFFGSGYVLDRSVRPAKGFARRHKLGHVCLLRPPIAEKVAAETEADRRCALFTDAATGAQPLRRLMPEVMRPVPPDAGERGGVE